jgi:predicted Zn-dependent protease
MKKHLFLVSAAAAVLGASAPPSGLPAAQPMTASDKKLGATEHPKIMEEFGGAYDGPQAAYVRTVGQKIALQTGLSNSASDFTVTLLNSNVNNAFAIPGGYTYVTRQLLALMNNEAELASVLGHEDGHVSARHSAQRQKRATTGGLLAAGATILGAVLGGGQGAQIGQQLGGNIATRYVMKFSRAQEYQADDLGVSYLAKAGYAPSASSTMLASLAAQTDLDAKIAGQTGQSVPAWASSHPDPASRVTRAAYNASTSSPTGNTTNRDAFLAAIDGMMYDDDPKQGVVEGQTFKHPDLKVTFTAPAGYTLSNGTQAVTVGGAAGKAAFTGAAYSGDLNAYVDSVFKQISAQNNNVALNYGSVEKLTINGIPAARASATVQGQSSQITVTVYAYEFSNTSAFHILAMTPVGGAGTFTSLFQSVRRLTDQEAAAIKPRRVEVITVRSGDTVDGIAGRMAYDNFKTERFLVLNALKAGEALKPGQKVKIIVKG